MNPILQVLMPYFIKIAYTKITYFTIAWFPNVPNSP